MHSVQVAGGARRLARTAVLAFAALLLSRSAEAAPSCTISVTGVSFGVYDVFSASPVDSTGTVTYNCRGNASVSVTLSAGSSATFNPRQMSGTGDLLSYNLFLDAARSTIWGDGTGGSVTYTNANPPNNRDIVVTMYARITAGQDVSADSYSDTITAIINF